MNTKPSDKTLHAIDIYPRWKSAVSNADESITIYSPYLDQPLVALLKSSKISFENIKVITDFDIPILIEHPIQLTAIKTLIRSGVSVYNLQRLHAKVLLVDDSVAILGSQNFTRYARHSKEASSGPHHQLENTHFLGTLIKWRQEAEPIDEDLVDSLLSKLEHRIRQHKKLIEETQTEFNEICKQHKQEKQNALIHRLEELERQSHIRMSQGVVYASIDYVPGEWGGYECLRADNEYDMTRWIIEKPNGSIEPYRLSRLSMYPMILADSNRMGFARIGKTRISYIRKGLSWTNRNLTVDNLTLKVSITFPENDTRKRNITVKFSHYSYLDVCEFDVLFTGDSSVIVGKRYFKNSAYGENIYDSFVKTLEKGFFDSTIHIDNFFQRFFTHFTYSKLGIDHKNVRDYLDGSRYRLSIIQYLENPYLVLKKVR